MSHRTNESPPGAQEDAAGLLRDPNLLAIFGVTLMAILGVASVAPAFPKAVAELGISMQSVGLLITAFTLPGVVLAPVLGVLADRWGRRRILVPSLFLFGIAGGACGFIESFPVIVALRFVQGVGAASLGVLPVTIIGDLYPGRRRAAAMGYNASVLSVGTGMFPMIGGALAGIAWYFPFMLAFLAIPIGLLVIVALRNPEPRSEAKLSDYLRGVWSTIAERRAIALLIAITALFIVLYGSFLTYFPLLLGVEFGAPPATIGIIMAAMSFTTAAVSSQLGRLTRWTSELSLLRAAFVMYAVALLMVPLMPGTWFCLIPVVVYGLGHGVAIPSQMTLQAHLAPPEQRAAIMSAFGMVLRLGQTLGPLVIGLFYAAGSMDATFHGGAVVALIGFLALVLLYREPASRAEPAPRSAAASPSET